MPAIPTHMPKKLPLRCAFSRRHVLFSRYNYRGVLGDGHLPRIVKLGQQEVDSRILRRPQCRQSQVTLPRLVDVQHNNLVVVIVGDSDSSPGKVSHAGAAVNGVLLCLNRSCSTSNNRAKTNDEPNTVETLHVDNITFNISGSRGDHVSTAVRLNANGLHFVTKLHGSS